MRRSTIAVAVLLAAAVFAPAARAFERSTVEDDPETPLFWRYRGVHVRAATDTCADVPAEAVALAVERSVEAWNRAAEGCSDFRLFHDGPPSGLTTNLDGGPHDGENRIVWREDAWPEDLPMETLAITTVVYRRSSGQILDADVDLNGVDHYWTDTTEPGAAFTDVQNTLTHELGHLLGLAHAVDPQATMYRESLPGDLDKRTLSDDDVAGLCHIYPEGSRSPASPLPNGMPLQASCRSAPGHRDGNAWMLALAAIGTWRALRSVRRRAPHR